MFRVGPSTFSFDLDIILPCWMSYPFLLMNMTWSSSYIDLDGPGWPKALPFLVVDIEVSFGTVVASVHTTNIYTYHILSHSSYVGMFPNHASVIAISSSAIGL